MEKFDIKNSYKYIPIIYLIFITLYLRLANLGYADYQGDEIKALYLPASGQSLLQFLFLQRKGPTQFLVTYLIRFFSDGYANRFITRLPFTLAGILAIYFFYKLVALHYGKKAALIASLLLTTDGIFIGLYRVVQYQPFVLLFSILALYAFSLALYRPGWNIRGVILGMLLWAAALISHYDGVFIGPFVLYLLYRWYLQNADLPVAARLKYILLPGAACAVLLLGFYIPLFFFASADTQQYWLTRITETSVVNHPSSSLFTFQIYNPLLTLYFYTAAGLLSLLNVKKALPVLAWFLFPWLVLEGIVRDPGTHIYAYLVPATLLVTFGLINLEELLVRYLGSRTGQLIQTGLLAVAMVFFSVIAHFIFIDHTPEYPWEQRRVLFWTLGDPDRTYYLWNYGFPYYRHWDEIRDYVMAHDPNGYYSTNEEKDIAGYYIPQAFDIDQSGYYIHIYHPTNFKDELSKEKIRYWMKNHPPVIVYSTEGRVVAEVYKMPAGTIDEIRSEGY